MLQSLTIQGLVVGVVAYLAQSAGVPLVEGELETFIKVLLALISVGMIYIGRIRKGDLTLLGGRK